MRTAQRNAGPSALPGVRPRSNQRSQSTTGRRIVPQLDELAAQLSARQLESVRTQVEHGERVAIYQGGDTMRVLLVGAQRLHRVAPQRLAGGWRLIGEVEVTPDGERSLPVVVA